MKFIKMAMKSSNIVIKTSTNMGIYGLHSVMVAHKRFLQSKCYMAEMNVYVQIRKLENCKSGGINVITLS